MFVAMIGILSGLYVILAVIHVIGVIMGAVFSGASLIPAEIFSGEGIAVGIAIGLALYFRLKKRNAVGEGRESCLRILSNG